MYRPVNPSLLYVKVVFPGGGLSCMHGMIQCSGVPHVICFFIMTEYSFIFIRKHVICFFIMGTR